MKNAFIMLLISVVFPTVAFEISQDNSIIKWKGSKSTGSYHDGNILVENGIINIDKNMILNGEIIIDMNSITCTDLEDENSNRWLVEHLKDDDFFSVSKFPIASLKIINTKQQKNNDYLITANLTIKDQTHPVDFIANIKINKDAALAIGKIDIDRSKYNIKYKSKTWYPDLGDRFINDIFELYFNLIALPAS